MKESRLEQGGKERKPAATFGAGEKRFDGKKKKVQGQGSRVENKKLREDVPAKLEAWKTVGLVPGRRPYFGKQKKRKGLKLTKKKKKKKKKGDRGREKRGAKGTAINSPRKIGVKTWAECRSHFYTRSQHRRR